MYIAGEDWMPFSELPELSQIARTGEDNPAIEKLEDALPEMAAKRQIGKDTPFRP